MLIAVISIAWILITMTIGYLAFILIASDFGSARGWWVTVYENAVDGLRKRNTWLLLLFNGGLVFGSQILFLLPVFRFDPEGAGRRSLRTSMVVAAFWAAVLSTSLLMGLVAVVQLMTGSLDDYPITFYIDSEAALIGEDLIMDETFTWIFVLSFFTLVASWILWSLVLIGFVQRRRVPDAVRRVTGLLLAGTLIEILLVVPLEAMVRRRADCYCGTGSFQMLLGSVLAGVWLLGPGIFLLMLSRRPAYWGRYCPYCGYQKGPPRNQPDQCPECGKDWQPEPEAAG